MLSLLKRKSDAAAAPEVPAWHPNFRNYEKLPDIKVVRTAFFINVAAITFAAALLVYFGFQEWKLRAIKLQVADWQRQIDRDKAASDQAVALFKKFQVEEAKITEVDSFVQSRLSLAWLMIRLAHTLPPNVAVDALYLRENGLAMRLSIKGAPAAASQTASTYLDELKNDAELAARFEKFDFTSTPMRNPTTGRVVVEFFLLLKGAKK